MPNKNVNKRKTINSYIYETSPKKLEPEYFPEKRKKNKNVKRKNTKNRAEIIKRKKQKLIIYIMIMFAILFGMGYQNSKINEQFSELKACEKKLSEIQKDNEQLRVNIENNLNLANLENMAKEQLGMQRASTEQTKYVRLVKKDYVELASEQIVLDSNENIFEKLIKFLLNILN